MAEIPVEKKSSKSWLWILLILLLIALLLWWLLSDNDDDVIEPADTGVAVEDTADIDSVAAPGEMTIANILANPSAYYGMDGFTGEVAVGGPLTDRGFWIEHEGSRMFAIIIDQPREVPMDINAGAMLQLTDGTVRNPATIGDDLPGVPLDADTMSVLEDQEAVLIVDEANIEIVDEA